MLPYFTDVRQADHIRDQVEHAIMTELKGSPVPEKDFYIRIRTLIALDLRDGSKQYVSIAATDDRKLSQNSHVAFVDYLDFTNHKQAELRPLLEQVVENGFEGNSWNELMVGNSELRIPFNILTSKEVKKQWDGNYWLYHMRFNTHDARRRGLIDEQMSDVLGCGYLGVTRRHYLIRMKEHFTDMRTENGHLFHEMWRQLITLSIPFRLIGQITGWASTEDEIYEMEEGLVDRVTLYPKGLNMIPGGRLGLSKLHSMGFMHANMSNIDKILQSALEQRSAITPHFRKSHIREYRPGKFTMVRGCWVTPNVD
jgi:hypothetical protein